MIITKTQIGPIHGYKGESFSGQDIYDKLQDSYS